MHDFFYFYVITKYYLSLNQRPLPTSVIAYLNTVAIIQICTNGNLNYFDTMFYMFEQSILAFVYSQIEKTHSHSQKVFKFQ